MCIQGREETFAAAAWAEEHGDRRVLELPGAKRLPGRVVAAAHGGSGNAYTGESIDPVPESVVRNRVNLPPVVEGCGHVAVSRLLRTLIVSSAAATAASQVAGS